MSWVCKILLLLETLINLCAFQGKAGIIFLTLKMVLVFISTSEIFEDLYLEKKKVYTQVIGTNISKEKYVEILRVPISVMLMGSATRKFEREICLIYRKSLCILGSVLAIIILCVYSNGFLCYLKDLWLEQIF